MSVRDRDDDGNAHVDALQIATQYRSPNGQHSGQTIGWIRDNAPGLLSYYARATVSLVTGARLDAARRAAARRLYDQWDTPLPDNGRDLADELICHAALLARGRA